MFIASNLIKGRLLCINLLLDMSPWTNQKAQISTLQIWKKEKLVAIGNGLPNNLIMPPALKDNRANHKVCPVFANKGRFN